MKSLYPMATAALVLMAAGAAPGSLPLLAQDAGTGHFLIAGNDIYRAPNSASVFALFPFSLVSEPALETTGWGIGVGYFGTNGQALATVGANVCAFVADPGSDDIAAFNVTNFSKPIGSVTTPIRQVPALTWESLWRRATPFCLLATQLP